MAFIYRKKKVLVRRRFFGNSLTGFTLLELVVVAGIIVILTAVTLANFSGFRSDLALQREANKISLVLRKAQTFALAVREFNSGPSYNDDPFCVRPPVRFPPYGVSFSTIAGAGGDRRSSQTYIIFGDSSCDTSYTAGGNNEEVEVFNIGNGVKITSIAGKGGVCAGGCDLTSAHAVYQRPAPTVVLSGSSNGAPVSGLSSIEVILEIPGQGLLKKVIITVTGQVSVE